MPDRLAEIRARLDAIGAWRLREEPEVFTQNAEGAFRTWAPHDIAWLLERESQMMGALAVMTDLAAYDGGAIGRESLDECLRDFGFTLDEVEARDER
jgi:hypothetical protein